MQTAYTVLILLMLVSLSRLLGRLIPLPLPLVQIAAGALLAWPTLGLHVALDPELFLFLFLPPLLFSDGWRMPKREFWRLRGPILTLAVTSQGLSLPQVHDLVDSRIAQRLAHYRDSAWAAPPAALLATIETGPDKDAQCGGRYAR